VADQRRDRERGERGGDGKRQGCPPGAAAAPARRRFAGRLDEGGLFRGAGWRRRRAALPGRRQVQGRVLAEDRQLELLELRARLDRQLLGQQRPPGTVGFQRLGLAAGPVEREHQLPAEPLAQGMLGHQVLQLRAQGSVPAERQLRLDPVLHREQAERFEPLDLEPGKPLELQVGQRPAAPQRLRLAQQHRGPARITVLKRVLAGGHMLLEHLQIQLPILDAE